MGCVTDTNSAECIIGRNIRKHRTLLGWTQAQLFDATGIERADISKYEGGTKGMPTIPVLLTFSAALGVSLSDLVEGVGGPSRAKKHKDDYEQLSDEHKNTVDQVVSAFIVKEKMEAM